MKFVPDGNGGFEAKPEGLEESLQLESPKLYEKFQSLKNIVGNIYLYKEFLSHIPSHGKADYEGSVEESKKEWKEYIKTVKYIQPGINSIIELLKPDKDLKGKLGYVIQADSPFVSCTKLTHENEDRLGTSCGAVGKIDNYDMCEEDGRWYTSFVLKDSRILTEDEIWRYAGAFYTWAWLRQPKDKYWADSFESELKEIPIENGSVNIIRDVLPCITWGII